MLQNNEDLVKYRLEKAQDEMELASLCIQYKKFSKSLNCSYYAIFHAARSLLALEKKDFKKHSAVISYFIANFIKTGLFDPEFGNIIKFAESDRNKSDYQDFFAVSREEAEEQMAKAQKFFNRVKEYIYSEK